MKTTITRLFRRSSNTPALRIAKRPAMSSQDILILLDQGYKDIMCSHEVFTILSLNEKDQLLSLSRHTNSSRYKFSIDSYNIISAIDAPNVKKLYIAHNHPSGFCLPSEMDIDLTNYIKKQCELYSVELLDHFILTRKHYFSFRNEGLML